MPVVLGSFVFVGFEAPETLPLGGRQALAKHRLMGGKRVVDALGPDDAPIRWSGRFRGPLAVLRARQLDLMRRAGKAHVLTWQSFAYRVVIEAFEAKYENEQEVPYDLTLEVIEDLVSARLGAAVESLESSILGGLSDAFGIAADSPALLGAVTGAQAAIANVASGGGFSLSSLTGAALAGVQGSVGAALGTAEGVRDGAMASIAPGSLGSVLAGPATGMAERFSGLLGASEAASSGVGVAARLAVARDQLRSAA